MSTGFGFISNTPPPGLGLTFKIVLMEMIYGDNDVLVLGLAWVCCDINDYHLIVFFNVCFFCYTSIEAFVLWWGAE